MRLRLKTAAMGFHSRRTYLRAGGQPCVWVGDEQAAWQRRALQQAGSHAGVPGQPVRRPPRPPARVDLVGGHWDDLLRAGVSHQRQGIVCLDLRHHHRPAPAAPALLLHQLIQQHTGTQHLSVCILGRAAERAGQGSAERVAAGGMQLGAGQTSASVHAPSPVVSADDDAPRVGGRHHVQGGRVQRAALPEHELQHGAAARLFAYAFWLASPTTSCHPQPCAPAC